METTIMGYTSLAAPRAALREEARILLLALVHMLYRSSCSPRLLSNLRPAHPAPLQAGWQSLHAVHIEKLTRLLNLRCLRYTSQQHKQTRTSIVCSRPQIWLGEGWPCTTLILKGQPSIQSNTLSTCFTLIVFPSKKKTTLSLYLLFSFSHDLHTPLKLLECMAVKQG